MNFILVDSNRENFLPLSFTRPVSDLRIGIFKISEKWVKLLGQPVSFLTEDYLSNKFPLINSDLNTFINSSVLPSPRLVKEILSLKNGESIVTENEWISYCSDEKIFKTPSLSNTNKSILCLKNWWDLFLLNGQEIENDIINFGFQKSSLSNTNILIGSLDKLFIHPSAKVEGAILNTTLGSIVIDENAEIMEGCLIRGPFYLGKNSTLKMGAKIYGATSIGPKCKVGGEVKNCIIQGYSNKSHEGYLGNSVLGEWINLGADTNCSNLKNTFDEVKVWDYSTKKLINSKQLFLGVCIGDYAKTGINTMINTGTVIGVNSNVFGEGFPPKHLPNFTWGISNLESYNIDKAISVNQKMANLLYETISPKDVEILNHLFKEETKK